MNCNPSEHVKKDWDPHIGFSFWLNLFLLLRF